MATSTDIHNSSAQISNSEMAQLARNIADLNDNLGDLLRTGGISQSSARDRTNSRSTNDVFGQSYRSGSWRRSNGPRGFTNNFESALMDSFFGPEFKRDMNRIARGFADKLGTDIRGIPDAIGQKLGQGYVKSLRNNPRYSNFFSAIDRGRGSITNSLQERGGKFLSSLEQGNMRDAMGAVRGFGSDLLSVGNEIASNLTPQIIGAAVRFKVLTTGVAAAGHVIEALSRNLQKLSNVANRDAATRKANIDAATKRMEADYRTLIETPFKILEEAAQKVATAWDNNLTTITATQGYTKSDVQDLMSALAQRLQAEGLSNYIAGTDIVENLSRVLKDGLSGAVAEAFAYQATILNKAVPTQDFFGYASTYASIAANAVRAGASQQEAIQKANESLQSFASGLLYASRELTGGFSTGLTNASSIYEQASKIAIAAQSDNMATIANVLLAVQGYVGATAPDLANQLTDAVFQALVGGNNSSIVALRSLAGVNASNTEFLREFARNPQKIFTTLFTNLSRMYTDSSDAYMEKAEGYAELFGLSKEAFQRVDFAQLAQAIQNMNTSNASLNQNMELLVEGQTTTTAEQMRAQQINKYMLDEGLSYVLDNEAARAIQQHMWEEQMARELQQTTYAVDLTGSSLDILNSIFEAVDMIINLLNPLAWFKKLGNLMQTRDEAKALDMDVKQVLELGKVGQGNVQSFRQLTTRDQNLNLTNPLVDMLGGQSMYAIMAGRHADFERWTNPLANNIGILDSVLPDSIIIASRPSSRYNWGSISKSQAAAAASALKHGSTNVLGGIQIGASGYAGTQSTSNSKISQIIESMLKDSYIVDQYVKQGKSYEDWAASAGKFGIADIGEAIQTAGYNVSDVQNYFKQKETEAGAQELEAIRQHEKQFRDAGIAHWTVEFPQQFRDPLFETLNLTNQTLDNIYKQDIAFAEMYQKEWLETGWSRFVSEGKTGAFDKFFKLFIDKFIEHTLYSSTSGYKYSDVEEIQQKAKAAERGDTVNALAKMLTTNLLDLQDPTMQTNALLAQILMVVNTIMNQTKTTLTAPDGEVLPESIKDTVLGRVFKASVKDTILNSSTI